MNTNEETNLELESNDSNLENSEEMDFSEENIESSFSPKQKLTLGLIGIFSFLLFLIFLFPLEEIARYFIAKKVNVNGTYLDFKRFNFSLIGDKYIDSIVYQLPSDMLLKAEEVKLNTGVYSFLRNNLTGDIKISSFNYESNDYELTVKSIQIDTNLINIRSPVNELNGTMEIQLSSGKIHRAPDIPFLGGILNNVDVKSGFFGLKIKAGNIDFEKAKINSSIADIQIKGQLKLLEPFGNSLLDLQFCPKLTKSFAQERSDIEDMISLLSKDGNEFCVKLNGTINQPKLNLPNMNK